MIIFLVSRFLYDVIVLFLPERSVEQLLTVDATNAKMVNPSLTFLMVIPTFNGLENDALLSEGRAYSAIFDFGGVLLISVK